MGVVVVFFSVDYLLLCDGISMELSQNVPAEGPHSLMKMCSLVPVGVGWNGEVSVI